jgi:hypothetical protein
MAFAEVYKGTDQGTNKGKNKGKIKKGTDKIWPFFVCM